MRIAAGDTPNPRDRFGDVLEQRTVDRCGIDCARWNIFERTICGDNRYCAAKEICTVTNKVVTGRS
jgi:hypothetical protein